MADAIKTAIDALKPTIAAAAQNAVKSSIGLDVGDAGQITADVTKQVAAIVVNQTNSEPWYQSAVTIGAIATLAGSLYGLAYMIATTGFPTPQEFTATAATITGAIITLWGRWINKRPLGA